MADQVNYIQYLKKMGKNRKFNRLSLQEQRKIIDCCIACGREAAQAVRGDKGAPDREALWNLVRSYGLQINVLDTKYDLPYIAEYTHRKRTITLYARRIRQMQDILAERHPSYFEKYDLVQMCLAHELFHHLESMKNGTTGRIAGIPGKFLGIFPYRSWMEEGSEIAAHSFVSALLDLAFNTYFFAEEMAAGFSEKQ